MSEEEEIVNQPLDIPTAEERRAAARQHEKELKDYENWKQNWSFVSEEHKSNFQVLRDQGVHTDRAYLISGNRKLWVYRDELLSCHDLDQAEEVISGWSSSEKSLARLIFTLNVNISEFCGRLDMQNEKLFINFLKIRF
ncbi:hypothetical protein MWH25_10335 [Natroniella acetigena]|uniref:hypothetical protein n=1 Tax=Natroniella acetigena TaxID=52004 RepID=UPI00200AB1B2|nr:hypothetical protein [Natroniella acetigena]MCK8828128.1 hypothetical protein [Natroniella acetigena]